MEGVEASRPEEKKEDTRSQAMSNVSKTNPTVTVPPPTLPLLSPSKQRAKAANSAGLSELSKQLRILQAKNEAQAIDVNRLERQLRILAELQGISVNDLRKALEDACANEAFGEMQHRVAKLRAELEAATLAKQKELRNNAAAPHIANLELRLGELEEVEENQQKEINHLFEQLSHERARCTRLEAENEQLKKDCEDYQNRWKKEAASVSSLESKFREEIQKLREEYETKLKENSQKDSQGTEGSSSEAVSRSTIQQSSEYKEMLKNIKEKEAALREAEAKLNSERDVWSEKLKSAEAEAREAQMNMKLDNDKMLLSIKQLEDGDSQNELRLAQYKARFSMQDERIDDMAQQLESLYAAFGLIKEDQDAEDLQRATLKFNLKEADAEIARQFEDQEMSNNQRGPAWVPNYVNGQSSSTPTFLGTPTRHISSPLPVATTPISRVTPVSAATSYTPTSQVLFSEENSAERPGLSSLSSPRKKGVLMSGTLLVKSRSVIRKWKQKHARLYVGNSGHHYILDLGEGKSYLLGFGISKIEFNPNHPLSFIIYTNPYDDMAPVVHAATVTEGEYHRWMASLTKVTTGDDYQTDLLEPPLQGTHDSSNDFGVAGFNSPSYVSHTPNQEDVELQRALELSRHQL